MNWFRKQPQTSGAETVAALAHSSDHWTSEIVRLNAEIDQLAVTRASLTIEAGRASLDRQNARAGDLANQIRETDTRREILLAAVEAATSRQADSERDEARKRVTLRVRAHYAAMVPWLLAHADVRAAEQVLAEAVQARNRTLDREAFGLAADELRREVVVPLLADVAGSRTPEEMRAEAARLRAWSETATVDEHGQIVATGEVIGQLPLTARDRQIAQALADQPDIDRRQQLARITAQLVDARHYHQRISNDRTAHAVDRDAAAAAVADLERQAAALAPEEVTV